jgi:hypothetical protein
MGARHLGWLLASLNGALMPVGSAAFAADAAAPPSESEEAIIVYGERNMGAIAGLRADSQLDENGIAAYGADTVGELLGALAVDDVTAEGPYILINGQPASGIDEVSDLPTEAVSRIQLLSRNAAGAFGQRPTRRVINVVIKPDHRQLTLNAKGRLATAGEGRQGEGEANWLRLDNGNRRSLVLRATGQDRLLESDRDIRSAEPMPFDPSGRELGRYRSLLPSTSGYSANGNITQKFGLHTVSVTLKGEHQDSASRTGAGIADLHLPASSPFSTFATDVTLPTVIADPLRQRGQSSAVTSALVANGPLGGWRYSFNANLARRWSDTRSDRGFDLAAFQAAIDAGLASPFLAPDPALLGALRIDRSKGDFTNAGAQAMLNGSPFKLPAGAARLALRLEWRLNRAHSTTDTSAGPLSRRLDRQESLAAANLQLPLFTSKSIGDLGAELSGALHHATASGWLHDTGYGLNWQPDRRISIRAVINNEQIAPPSTALTDPIVILENVRVFDFIRQETVFVRYLTGGNPDLGIERRRTASIGVSWNPFDKEDLNLTADYRNVRSRGAFASLPPVNADVQAAFPDRFQRDLSGRLIAVDARPVPFDSVRRDELRWGAMFSKNIGNFGLRPTGGGSSEDNASAASGWRLSAFLFDTWTLASRRRARDGLPTVDLLDGGAMGYGGGVPRHRISFGGGVIHRGIGLQVDGDWTGPSKVATGTLAAPDRLRFSSRALLDARLFVNLGPQLPNSPWATGARISLGVENLFDAKIRVRDSAGLTPIGYQPYLLDPLGRVVTLAFRKAF